MMSSLRFLSLTPIFALAMLLASQFVVANTSFENESLNPYPRQKAAFDEIVYHYFQAQHQQVLTLIAVAKQQHSFSSLQQEDQDRLDLMLGAAQLNVGLYQRSQSIFANLLQRTTSDYVQANTWFFMAKAGFANKQTALSEQAYKAIVDQNLVDSLEQTQWHELLYLTAHTRMLASDDWQTLSKQIPIDDIYSTYLLTNHALMLFNRADYQAASDEFVRAKQALLQHQARQGLLTELADTLFDTFTFLAKPLSWFSGAQHNSQAPRGNNLNKEQDAEQNALFDRINVGLGQSLLQQNDLVNAVAVFQTVAEQGAEAQQAILAYAWANARDNRWQSAMSAFQYLQDTSQGEYALQASYGLAYSFSEQDNLGQAFVALKATSQYIDTSLSALNQFKLSMSDDTFFDDFFKAEQIPWPLNLSDLQLTFFQASNDFDAQYLLDMRKQLAEFVEQANDKEQRAQTLIQLLNDRQVLMSQRLSNLDLSQISIQIETSQAHINSLDALISHTDSFEQKLTLAKRMASNQLNQNITRINNAQQRHARLLNDDSRKRPISPKYNKRLERIKGIITWRLMDNFTADKWQHEQSLQSAKDALASTQKQYLKLQQLLNQTKTEDLSQVDLNTFERQAAFETNDTSSEIHRLTQLIGAIQAQKNRALTLYAQTTEALSASLLATIAQRQTQLEQQAVNTRLAMLRIQDLQQGAQ